MLLVGAIGLGVPVLPPRGGVALVTLSAVIDAAELGFWIRFLRRYRNSTGKEALIGSSAQVIEACDPRGPVCFRGEIWHAECEPAAAVGDRVRIKDVHGLTLRVELENGKGPH